MIKKTRILLTNDDGINSEGLFQLWSALKDYADIFIVAPSTERSGCGQSISFKEPIIFNKYPWIDDIDAWSIDGTPADCINLALKSLLSIKPDLVISGINRGSNAGRSIFYSGTIGAAMEAVTQGVPAIAFSVASNVYSSEYLDYIIPIVDYFLKFSLPDHTCININIPHGQIKGCSLARQGLGLWKDDIIINKTIENSYSAKLINGRFDDSFDEVSDSDAYLLKKGYITAVPIKIYELTHDEYLRSHQKTFKKTHQPLPALETSVY